MIYYYQSLIYLFGVASFTFPLNPITAMFSITLQSIMPFLEYFI